MDLYSLWPFDRLLRTVSIFKKVKHQADPYYHRSIGKVVAGVYPELVPVLDVVTML